MSALTITALRARAVIAPLARPLRNATGTFQNAPLLLLDVETREGVTGSTYAFGYAAEALRPMVAFIEDLSPSLQGVAVNPADVARMLEEKFRLLGRQGLVGIAISTLDMALWDALGKSLDAPVARLLGAEPRPIPAYHSNGMLDADQDRDVLETAIRDGFRALKVKTGALSPQADARMIRGIREVIGPDIALMVDYNQSMSVPEAIMRIRLLEEFELTWVEEPVVSENLAGHAAIRQAVSTPIQTGENWWFAADMANAIAAGACDMAMPDVIKIGGITGWLGLMGQAEGAGIPLSNHCHIEANAHAMAPVMKPGWFEWMDLGSAVMADPMRIVDGGALARGPGLGIVWDEAAITRYTP